MANVLVYGGYGALGAACVKKLLSQRLAVTSIDVAKNPEATHNVVVPPSASWADQDRQISSEVAAILGAGKLQAIVCVAGGWAGGNASSDLVATTELMVRQSILTSTIAAQLAARHLAPGGMLALTGSAAATGPTAGMMGYGLAKAAVHHLTLSLAGPDAGLPPGAAALCILPVTLDTPNNRKYMQHQPSWTPLNHVADLFANWTLNPATRPASGSLFKLVTADGKTTLETVS
eukprot:m.232110 g.232110  ORF g.232110 m.232110 type:complete len:233 (+) comp18582_c0_seq1:34-732(+)